MINTETLFILGAGGSYDLGYPLGSKLLSDICLRLKDSHSEFFTSVSSLTHNVNHIKTFRNDLIASEVGSIDQFLEHRRNFIDIGRICIAIIIREQDHKVVFNRDHQNYRSTWYSVLWSKLSQGLENSNPRSILNNKIKIMTYNYDTSLERYLMHSISGLYGIKLNIANDIVKSLDIHHIHGKLEYTNDEDYFNNEQSVLSFTRGYEGIKIIHESDKESPEYEKAHSFIQWANKIVILGFGFHPDNVKRLNISGHNLESTIYSSYIGMGAAEIIEAQSSLKVDLKRIDPMSYRFNALTDLIKNNIPLN